MTGSLSHLLGAEDELAGVDVVGALVVVDGAEVVPPLPPLLQDLAGFSGLPVEHQQVQSLPTKLSAGQFTFGQFPESIFGIDNKSLARSSEYNSNEL